MLGGNNLAGRWLAGVNLLGVALGCRRSLLADERFLFDSHCGVSRFILTALRDTLEQANSQTAYPRKQIFKSLKTQERIFFVSLA